VFQLNDDTSGFASFEIEDNSSINITEITSTLQRSIADECFTARDVEAVLKTDLLLQVLGLLNTSPGRHPQ
jgi:hypothetical protein